MTRIFARLAPAAVVAVLTLVAVLPWGLPPASRFYLPLLPLTAIHYWALRRPEFCPEWLAFASGLTVDVLSDGPLGFWALVYLACFALARIQANWGAVGPLGRWLAFLFALLFIAGLEWMLASLIFGQLADGRPFAIAGAAAGLGYPFLAALMRALEGGHSERENRNLVRGS